MHVCAVPCAALLAVRLCHPRERCTLGIHGPHLFTCPVCGWKGVPGSSWRQRCVDAAVQVLSGELDVDSVPTKTFREIQEAFKQSQVLYQELAATCAEMQAVADAAPAALNAKQAPAKTPPDAKKAAASKVWRIDHLAA